MLNCSAPAPDYPDGWCGVNITTSEGMFLKPTNTPNSLFLAGNRFSTANASALSADDVTRGIQSGRLPKWMENNTHGDPMTKGAPFLYLHVGGWDHILSSFTKPAVYLLGGALTLALVTYGLVWSGESGEGIHQPLRPRC